MKEENKILFKKICSKEPFTINFICSGNIIRSPYSEMLFENLMGENDSLNQNINVQSGGVVYRNQMISKESALMLVKEGISKERINQFSPRYHHDYPEMFKEADLILVMEQSHLQHIPEKYKEKSFLFLDFVYGQKKGDVPDPYFDPPFERAYNMIKDALKSLVEQILQIQREC
ncbi:MAG: arsenate reductase/protein-tyrosine-phosphatase family protein [Candidatus Hodarchaeales archaeon]